MEFRFDICQSEVPAKLYILYLSKYSGSGIDWVIVLNCTNRNQESGLILEPGEIESQLG